MKKLRENKKGFTLIEMIVVIVIIAILAAIAVPAVMKYIEEARETKLITYAGSAKTSMEAELAKIQAKTTAGNITETEAENAAKNVLADTDLHLTAEPKICGTVTVAEGKYTCGDVSYPATLGGVKGYVFKYEGDKEVVVTKDGVAEIATLKP